MADENERNAQTEGERPQNRAARRAAALQSRREGEADATETAEGEVRETATEPVSEMATDTASRDGARPAPEPGTQDTNAEAVNDRVGQEQTGFQSAAVVAGESGEMNTARLSPWTLEQTKAWKVYRKAQQREERRRLYRAHAVNGILAGPIQGGATGMAAAALVQKANEIAAAMLDDDEATEVKSPFPEEEGYFD